MRKSFSAIVLLLLLAAQPYPQTGGEYRIDVLLAIDVTAGMSAQLDYLKQNFIQIASSIKSAVPDTHFGLVTFADYPGAYDTCGYNATYGAASDNPYRLMSGLTGSTAAIQSGLSSLQLGDGQDDPEAYTRVFYESYSDTNIGWRTGAKKVLLLWGNSIPHDCSPGLDCAAFPSTGDDPGSPIDLAAALADMSNSGISLVALYSGPANDFPLWNCYAGKAGVGGGAFQGYVAGQEITNLIVSQLPNQPPVASGQSVTTPEDQPLLITLLASDPDGDELSYTVVSGPAHGALSGTAPNLTYAPTIGYSGSDSFTFKAYDGLADSGSATISITVTANSEQGMLEVTPEIGLTSKGPPGGPFSPISISYTVQNKGASAFSWTIQKTQPWIVLSGGGGTLEPGGAALVSVAIGPAANLLVAGTYSDTVTFTNTTNHGGDTTRALTIIVSPPNNPPVASAGPDQTIEATGPTTYFTLNGAGSHDPDGDPISYKWQDSNGNVVGATSSVNLARGLGTHMFTLAVTDSNNAASTDSVTITIRDTTPPTIVAPAPVTVDQRDPYLTPADLGLPTVADLCDPNPIITKSTVGPFPLGETIVTWTATDHSGNSATAQQKVTVVPGSPANQFSNLTKLIEYSVAAGKIDAELEQSLLAKVAVASAAIARADANYAKTAMNDLKALVNQVKAQTDKKITPDIAAQLIICANRIIKDLRG
jgi:hypothetical protein